MDKRIQTLNNAERRAFSTWENRFIDSVYRQSRTGKAPSKKQLTVIDRLHYKYQERLVGDYDERDPVFEAGSIFHD